MIEEHWLLHDQLHILSSYHEEFSAVAVSGISRDEYLCGRPYGGCAILYRNLFHLAYFLLNPTPSVFMD